MTPAEREALEHVAFGAILHGADGWSVQSPAWWNGFDGPDLDALLAAGLIRIIPSRRDAQSVRTTAAGRKVLA